MAKQTVKKGWLKTRNGEYYAPSTIMENVFDGTTGKSCSEIVEESLVAIDNLEDAIEIINNGYLGFKANKLGANIEVDDSVLSKIE